MDAMDQGDVVQRAMGCARKARRSLADAAEALKGARRWGLFDLFGGGWFASSIKHDRVNEARSHLRRARRYLRALGEECAALGLGGRRLDAGLNADRASWNRGFDVWLDDPFTDMGAQTRIGNLSKAVVRAQRRLARTVDELTKLRSGE
ncbi:MAG: hypothetical protein GY711_19510 [bacterium]|nr:hypothetical protein [bacterium]